MTTTKQTTPAGATLRPWGWYDSIASGANGVGFQVKRIYVNAGESLSLQSHQHRAEHWVVVQGVATIVVGSDLNHLQSQDYVAGEHVYIPKKAIHRLSNNTKQSVEVIEVQCGSYLGEDDIVRYQDVYGRT